MHQDKSYQWKTVRNAIADLEFDKGECATLSEERLKFLKMIPEGGNWRDCRRILYRLLWAAHTNPVEERLGFTEDFLMINHHRRWLHPRFRKQQ